MAKRSTEKGETTRVPKHCFEGIYNNLETTNRGEGLLPKAKAIYKTGGAP